MIMTSKILPVALIAALIGASLGAAVMHSKDSRVADTTTALQQGMPNAAFNSLPANFNTYSEQSGRPFTNNEIHLLQSYAQDEWRFNRRLTLNYGVRVGYHSPFFQRDAQGIPRQWIQRIRRAMVTLVPKFTTARMVKEYAERYYLSK